MTRFDDRYAVANFLSPEFMTKFQREVPLFLEIIEFLFNTVWDGWKEAHMPKTSSIRSTVSIEHRLVTDGQTQYRECIASRGKSLKDRRCVLETVR